MGDQPADFEERSFQPNLKLSFHSTSFYVALVIVGVMAGIAAGLLMKLLHAVQHMSYSYHVGTFLAAVEHVAGHRRIFVLLLAGLLGSSVLYVVDRITGKDWRILPEFIWCKAGEMPTLPTILRSAVSIALIGAGMPLGREGAMKEASGALAAGLSRLVNLTPMQRRALVAFGAGAGMGAAYNVPLGGALFAAEVLLGSLSLSTVLSAIIAALIANSVSWFLIPNQITYHVPSLRLSRSLMAWAFVLAPIMGVVAAGYIRAVGWAGTHKSKGWHKITVATMFFSLLGIAAIRFPELLGSGKNIVQLAYSNQMNISLLCWLVLLRPLATVLTLRTGLPGGLFTPTMAFGAVLGQAFGRAWGRIWPGADANAFAFIGSGALLAAATQGPISSIVFVLELAHNGFEIAVPLLLSVAGACLISCAVEPHSIYSIRIS